MCLLELLCPHLRGLRNAQAEHLCAHTPLALTVDTALMLTVRVLTVPTALMLTALTATMLTVLALTIPQGELKGLEGSKTGCWLNPSRRFLVRPLYLTTPSHPFLTPPSHPLLSPLIRPSHPRPSYLPLPHLPLSQPPLSRPLPASSPVLFHCALINSPCVSVLMVSRYSTSVQPRSKPRASTRCSQCRSKIMTLVGGALPDFVA
jgi:hypothetical protein